MAQASSFDDVLRRAAPMDDIERRRNGQAQTQGENNQEQSGASMGLPSGDLRSALAPVLNAEKTDAMFWMMAAQTVLLYLIWRKL